MTDPRRLPAVHSVLEDPDAEHALQRWGRERFASQVGAVLSELREQIQSGATLEAGPLEAASVAKEAAARLQLLGARRQIPVINATGVIVHTNLGRSVLSSSARRAVAEVSGSYTTLELDRPTGQRGSRQGLVHDLLCHLSGAEAALVVNNNAAAVLLALSVLARGREVVISRGQLVEIGGSFRIPDVMRESGARLVEVGTTNRTHLDDYRRAVGPNTALLMEVHPSNYRITGFTAQVAGEDLVSLGGQLGVPVILDLGSGVMEHLPGSDEPRVSDVVAVGYDLVAFSGDKALGGPQAGIMLGRGELMDQLRAHPLMRAIRPDKLQLAALEATLVHYLVPGEAAREIPTLRMLGTGSAELQQRASRLAAAIASLVPQRMSVSVEPVDSRVGGGAAPERYLDSYAVMLDAAGRESALATALRLGSPAVVARVAGGRLILDPRTMLPGEDEQVVEAFRALTLR